MHRRQAFFGFVRRQVRACVLNNACSPRLKTSVVFVFLIINIIGKIFEYNFLIDLFGDRNVTYIFYKSS
jgi:hypothetical protein